MSDQNTIRQTVSKTYARAVTAPSPAGCRESDKDSKCCAPPLQKGEVVKLAGYDPNELNQLPADTVINSFGCGNPVAYGGLQPGDVVVDLGSGAGIDILLAGKKVGPTGRVIGVDMTDEMLEKAQANIALSGLSNVEVRKGIIEQLPVDSQSVDWIISNCVINLSPEKPRVFAEIARVLKPGGQMLVSDIVVDDLPRWVKENEHLYCSCIAGAISEDEYVQGLKQAGLAEVQVRDRIQYTTGQLKDLLVSELPQAALPGDPAELGSQQLEEMIQQLDGKIWSANIYARRA